MRKQRPPMIQLTNKTVVVDVSDTYLRNVMEKRVSRYRAKLLPQTRRTVAYVFIVDDVQDIGQRNEWCAVLRGAYVCDHHYVTPNGKTGAMCKYRPTYNIITKVWPSLEFLDHHKTLISLMEELATQPNRKWKILEGTVDDFKTGRRNFKEIKGLVTVKEKSAKGVLSKMERALSVTDFLANV
jgi:hypothetical protein